MCLSRAAVRARTGPMTSFQILQTTQIGRKPPPCIPENQDRVLCRDVSVNGDQQLLIGVADGVTRCPCGGAVAEYLVEKRLAQDSIFHAATAHAKAQLVEYLRGVEAGFYEEFAGRSEMTQSACTLSVALLQRGRVHALWVGDSPMFVARRNGGAFAVTQISMPDLSGRLLTDCFGAFSRFHLKEAHADLAPGDVFIVASDGATRDAETLEQLLNAHGVTQSFLRALEQQAGNAEYYDDASIVLAQLRE